MKTIIVNRIYQSDKVTLGEATLYDEQDYILLSFKTLELPWRNNQRGKSCIIAQRYMAKAVRRFSNGKYALHLNDANGREQVMVHTGNFTRQIHGCLLPGKMFKDIDKDGIVDVTDSKEIMMALQKHIPLGEKVEIVINDYFKNYGMPNIKTLVP